MRRTRTEQAALKVPTRNKQRDYYEGLNERLTAAFEAAQLKPGSLILPKIKGEAQLEQRTKDKLARQRALLESIREGATMGEALKDLRISRMAVTSWIRKDSYFASAFSAAKDDRTDLAEKALRHAAIKGPRYIVASGGKLIGYNEVPDVKAQIAILKAERPEQFGDKREIAISGQVQFSRPDQSEVLAQVRRMMRLMDEEGIVIPDLPSLPSAVIEGEVIDGVVVDHAQSDSISEDDL